MVLRRWDFLPSLCFKDVLICNDPIYIREENIEDKERSFTASNCFDFRYEKLRPWANECTEIIHIPFTYLRLYIFVLSPVPCQLFF